MHRLLLTLWLAIAFGVAIAIPAPPAGPQAPDPRFGIVESYVDPAAASEAGAGYTRIILRWDAVQPQSPADWKPANVPDPLIARDIEAGREVVGLLIGTPAWAAEAGSEANGQGTPSPGSAAYGARAVPDMEKWRAFVTGMAQQYRGRIRHWIIWNEPDVWQIDHPGNTWAGTVEDYYRLLKTAYLAVKDVDPTLKVHVAGLTYFWDAEHGRRQFLARLLDVIVADPEAPAHGYYFDAIVYHLYFKPAQLSLVLGQARDLLAAHGITGKGLWLNETNAPPSEDPVEPPWSPAHFRISLSQQAAFVLQEFALAFANGAERVEFYKLRNTADHPESIEPYGLLRGDGSRRPAFEAYRVASTYLRGFRTVTQQQAGPIHAITFDRGSETTTVLWTDDRSPASVRVRAITKQGQVVDESGRAQKVIADGDLYALDLPGAACPAAGDCFIGGAPRLLVEEGAPTGRAALLPPPTPTPRPAATSTPAASPAATATRRVTTDPTPLNEASPPPTPTGTPAPSAIPTDTALATETHAAATAALAAPVATSGGALSIQPALAAPALVSQAAPDRQPAPGSSPASPSPSVTPPGRPGTADSPPALGPWPLAVLGGAAAIGLIVISSRRRRAR